MRQTFKETIFEMMKVGVNYLIKVINITVNNQVDVGC